MQLVAQKGLPEVLNDVISNIVGFFGIESIARHTSDEPDYLFSNSQLTSMFDFACEEVDLLVRKHYRSIRNPDIALQVKEQVVLMCELMADETFELRSKTIYRTVKHMWNVYCYMLEGVMVNNTLRALGKGQYQPFYVSSQSQYETYIQPFNLGKTYCTIASKLAFTYQYANSCSTNLKENIEVDFMSERFVTNNDDVNRIGGGDMTGSVSRDRRASMIADTSTVLNAVNVDPGTLLALENVDNLEKMLEKEMKSDIQQVAAIAVMRDSKTINPPGIELCLFLEVTTNPLCYLDFVKMKLFFAFI
jgi:hypothetical protein